MCVPAQIAQLKDLLASISTDIILNAHLHNFVKLSPIVCISLRSERRAGTKVICVFLLSSFFVLFYYFFVFFSSFNYYCPAFMFFKNGQRRKEILFKYRLLHWQLWVSQIYGLALKIVDIFVISSVIFDLTGVSYALSMKY